MFYLVLSMLFFLPPQDPSLNRVSDQVCPCEIQSDPIQKTIDTMIDFAYGNTQERTKSILVGLAAPQVGIQKRIILVDTAATGIFTKDLSPPSAQLKIYINPEILWKSDEMLLWREGCFSTANICGIVPRAAKILVRAYDRTGMILTEELEGYTARIFQHEVDHLDGIRFPDRIDQDEDLHWVDTEEIADYRIQWPHWKKKCPRETWNQLRDCQ